jgi:hypothetical protein
MTFGAIPLGFDERLGYFGGVQARLRTETDCFDGRLDLAKAMKLRREHKPKRTGLSGVHTNDGVC